MNINKLFKFKKCPRLVCHHPQGMLVEVCAELKAIGKTLESYDVIHRDSDHTVADVTKMPGGDWQAHRNGKVFDASTRAAAVWGLTGRDLGLLTLRLQEIAKCNLTETPSVRVSPSYRTGRRKLDRNSSATESKAAAIAALEDAIKRFPPITPDMHNGVHDLEALKTYLAILRDGATPMRYK